MRVCLCVDRHTDTYTEVLMNSRLAENEKAKIKLFVPTFQLPGGDGASTGSFFLTTVAAIFSKKLLIAKFGSKG